MLARTLVTGLDPARPVLIAGPTASGKSDLALAIAVAQGREVVNADALQVFESWRVLSARPDRAALALATHRLYGHVPFDADYSAGHWLREIAGLAMTPPAPVIVGGTGLYFTALTEGLAEMPATDPALRREADRRRARGGLDAMIAQLDAPTRQGIDLKNPMRVQRAWEVLMQTGRGLAEWQATTGPPLLALEDTHAFVIDAQKDWLDRRIAARFDAMMAGGAREEVRAVLPRWDPGLPAAKAIGARELVAMLRGEISESEAVERATTASRRYAKRQRTWFRARMRLWHRLDGAEIATGMPQQLRRSQ